ncbi:MAG: hypothetical protein JWR70_1378 [Modestobacter sp.]|nr:hypothetical protein [Modestobacter sp.]
MRRGVTTGVTSCVTSGVAARTVDIAPTIGALFGMGAPGGG